MFGSTGAMLTLMKTVKIYKMAGHLGPVVEVFVNKNGSTLSFFYANRVPKKSWCP